MCHFEFLLSLLKAKEFVFWFIKSCAKAAPILTATFAALAYKIAYDKWHLELNKEKIESFKAQIESNMLSHEHVGKVIAMRARGVKFPTKIIEEYLGIYRNTLAYDGVRTDDLDMRVNAARAIALRELFLMTPDLGS